MRKKHHGRAASSSSQGKHRFEDPTIQRRVAAGSWGSAQPISVSCSCSCRTTSAGYVLCVIVCAMGVCVKIRASQSPSTSHGKLRTWALNTGRHARAWMLTRQSVCVSGSLKPAMWHHSALHHDLYHSTSRAAQGEVKMAGAPWPAVVLARTTDQDLWHSKCQLR